MVLVVNLIGFQNLLTRPKSYRYFIFNLIVVGFDNHNYVDF